jgi:hypothetical protein
MEDPVSPSLIAAAAAIAAVIPTVLVVLVVVMPTVRAFLNSKLSAHDAEALKAAVKGAYMIVSQVAALTPNMPLDDGVAKMLEIVDTEFKLLKGRPLTPAERSRAGLIGLSMSADERLPGSLGAQTQTSVQRALAQALLTGKP